MLGVAVEGHTHLGPCSEAAARAMNGAALRLGDTHTQWRRTVSHSVRGVD